MKTLINKTGKGYSLNVFDCNTEYNLNDITKEELKTLRDQIDDVLNEKNSNKIKVKVWNPRSQRHEIIEQ